MPKRSKSSPSVVPGLEQPVSAAAPAAAQSGPRPPKSKKCPICRSRPATTEVTLGVVSVKICDDCSALAYNGLGFLNALKRFL